MRKDEALAKLKTLQPLLQRHRVVRLRVYGSVARDEAGPDSDLDLIVDFSKKPDLLNFIDLQNELSDALGVKVDLATSDSLRSELKAGILAEAIDAKAA